MKMKKCIKDVIKIKLGGSAEDNKPLGRWLLAISIISVICTLISAGFAFRIDGTTKDTNARLGTLFVTAGVYNGEGAFVQRVDAELNQEVPVQMLFRNISGRYLGSVGGRISLPEELEFVPGSAVLYNRTNPRGIPLADDIFDAWVDLGGYNIFDGTGYGEGSVSFRVKVLDNPELFVSGVNTFNIACYVGGYGDGELATNTYVAYAAVDITQ